MHFALMSMKKCCSKVVDKGILLTPVLGEQNVKWRCLDSFQCVWGSKSMISGLTLCIYFSKIVHLNLSWTCFLRTPLPIYLSNRLRVFAIPEFVVIVEGALSCSGGHGFLTHPSLVRFPAQASGLEERQFGFSENSRFVDKFALFREQGFGSPR